MKKYCMKYILVGPVFPVVRIVPVILLDAFVPEVVFTEELWVDGAIACCSPIFVFDPTADEVGFGRERFSR